MELNFTKMQGAGNDYLYLDCRRTGLPPDAAALAVQLSRRHYSVGADGVIYLCPPLLVRQRRALCGGIFIHPRCTAGLPAHRHTARRAAHPAPCGRRAVAGRDGPLYRCRGCRRRAGARPRAAAGAAPVRGRAQLAGQLRGCGQPPLCHLYPGDPARRGGAGPVRPRAGASPGLYRRHQC